MVELALHAGLGLLHVARGDVQIGGELVRVRRRALPRPRGGREALDGQREAFPACLEPDQRASHGARRDGRGVPGRLVLRIPVVRDVGDSQQRGHALLLREGPAHLRGGRDARLHPHVGAGLEPCERLPEAIRLEGLLGGGAQEQARGEAPRDEPHETEDPAPGHSSATLAEPAGFFTANFTCLRRGGAPES